MGRVAAGKTIKAGGTMNYEYEVRGFYESWEAVYTASTKGEALDILQDYRTNEPSTPFAIKRVRAI